MSCIRDNKRDALRAVRFLRTGGSLSFQKLERFIVTPSLEEVRQLRVDRLRKRPLYLIDFFRDSFQAIDVGGLIEPTVFVPDNGKALS